MNEGMKYIRDTYGVPAQKGGRVRFSCPGFKAKDGVITGHRNAYLVVRMDGDKHSRTYHPTWCIEYL